MTDIDYTPLATAIRGDVVLPDDEEYDEARKIWNAMVDKRPAAIVYCQNVNDAKTALGFARANGLPIAIRGGGHGVAGKALVDDGMVIDMSRMKGIRVDTETNRVWAQAGCTLGDVDPETQAYGLVVPFGVVSLTGIAGLTLGGGLGHVMRSCGLTCDNLVSADIITAEGELLTVDENRHPDLFWALRGGGGNFGVVTAFEYQAHKIGPMVAAGGVTWAAEDAPEVLRFLNEFMKTAPDELGVVTAFTRVSDSSTAPSELRGRLVFGATLVWNGTVADGMQAFAPIREFGSPLLDTVQPMLFTDLQRRRDGSSPARQSYWKSGYIADITDEFIDVMMEYVQKTSGTTIVEVVALGGAVARVPADATAFGSREGRFAYGIFGLWNDPAENPEQMAWIREFYEALQAHSVGGAYINYVDADEAERMAAIYGGGYERLAQIKAKYDPENLFRINHNIVPAGR